MKTLGIIGGIAPESTVACYRQLIAAYRARTQDDSYPPILINSIDLTRMLGYASSGDLDGLAGYITAEVEKLARGGADVGMLASNLPHLVFDQIASRSPIPLISIVEAARDYAAAHGHKTLGLFGARFTMQSDFYDRVFAPAGIALVRPQGDDLIYVQEKYLGELAKAIFLPETREGLLAVVDRLKAQGIDGVILGGTELPLLLTEPSHNGIPLLDTGRIHVARVIETVWG